MGNLTIFFAFIALTASATTFSPVTIRDQIKESQGLVQGEVVSVNSERDPEHGVVSRVFLKADRWMDAPVKDGHIEVYFPGGEAGGEGRLVHGAPRFKAGEKVVLFTSAHGGRNWVRNLGLGKFSIKKIGRAEIIVNQIFPQLPDVGQMPLRSFLALAKSIKEKDFKERFKDKYERSAEKSARFPASIVKRGRYIASVEQPSNPVEKPSPLWLVLLLGLMGTAARLTKAKKRR